MTPVAQSISVFIAWRSVFHHMGQYRHIFSYVTIQISLVKKKKKAIFVQFANDNFVGSANALDNKFYILQIRDIMEINKKYQ